MQQTTTTAKDLTDKKDEPARAGGGRRAAVIAAPLMVFAALALMFSYALKTGDPSRLPSTLIGKPAPVTNLPALEGLTQGGKPVPGFTSADLANGQVTVINFWASWCTSCVQEHPLLKQIAERTGARIFGVDYKDQAADARRFLGRYGNPYSAVGVDSGRAGIDWGVYGMPESFIVNGKGEVVFKHVGPISPESLERQVIPVIEKAKRG